MTDTTITLTHKGIEYIMHPAMNGCEGCVFAHGNDCTAPGFVCEYDCAGDVGDVIWLKKNPECCGQPNTCEQPCFHVSGRTTPGQPGGIASVPQPRAEVRSSDGWVTWDGGEMPVTGMVEVRYRNGATNTDDADSFLWDHSDCPNDIVAYRKVTPASEHGQNDADLQQDNSAASFLREAVAVMEQRGQQYDTEGGERSFEAAANAFNAITGYEITAADVALVQVCIKLVRSQSRAEPHRDSLLDAVAYMALHGEERMKDGA